MADNVQITAGTGTSIAADDIGGGVLAQRIKLGLGADGTAVDAVGGAGAVSTAVQRVTLASDDPGVALLTTIDADTGTIAAVDFAVETGGNLATIAAVDFATESGGNLDDINTNTTSISTNINNALVGEYETVAASQSDQSLGATGGSGDFLAGLLIVPATTSPGAVSIKDGAGSAITVFTGGADSVTNLVPFFIPLGIKSGSGAWKVTTGSNVSAIGTGNFT